MPLPWLAPDIIDFPPADQALDDPNGLLAAGGALTPRWLLAAYRQGIFPWFEADQPLLWWSPDPRLVLVPDELYVAKSLKKLARQGRYWVTLDTDFGAVIRGCAAAEARQDSAGTWITAEMQSAYGELHELGYAHSVEVWDGERLIGGLYGLSLGRMFFGESMFSLAPNASKLALLYLVRQVQRWNFALIDCQVSSEHLISLGAREMARAEFLAQLRHLLDAPDRVGRWQFDADLDVLSDEL